MPAILKENITKLNENLTQSFKKSEKENYENHPTPTVKQVLSAKIEYEEIPNYTNTLNSLQTKYIILKPNQQPLNGKFTFLLLIPFFLQRKSRYLYIERSSFLCTYIWHRKLSSENFQFFFRSFFFIILFSQTFSLSF